MTTPEIAVPEGELTPLSDPDNVQFIIIDDEEEGFTFSEVNALMNAPARVGEAEARE